MQVELFIPCLVDQFYPRVGIGVTRVFEKLGLAVSYNPAQTCCGQPFFKSGYWNEARKLARKTLVALGQSGDYVVAPSGSCVHMIRNHFQDLFSNDPEWLDRASALSERIYEFSEFLVRVLRVEDLGACFRAKVTYHDSCQVSRGLGISAEPRQLLKQVKEIQFVGMDRADECCGFGGIFSFKSPHISRTMVEDKIENILATGAEVVTGCEISCLMHIGGYLAHRGIPVRALHLADLLALGL